VLALLLLLPAMLLLLLLLETAVAHQPGRLADQHQWVCMNW
jgi:hypothetical protein